MTDTAAICRELDKGIAALENASRPGLKTRKKNAWINVSRKHMRRANRIHDRGVRDAMRAKDKRKREAIAMQRAADEIARAVTRKFEREMIEASRLEPLWP